MCKKKLNKSINNGYNKTIIKVVHTLIIKWGNGTVTCQNSERTSKTINCERGITIWLVTVLVTVC